MAAGQQLVRVRRVQVRTARTADRGRHGPPTSGPSSQSQSQPAEVLEDAGLRLRGRSLGVGVLDAQDERAVVAARQQPVEERRAGVADVELTGRTRCKSNSHHAGSVHYDQASGSIASSATACAAIASPRPTASTPSLRLALDAHPRSVDRRRRCQATLGAMRSMNGEILGRSRITVTSRLTMLEARGATPASDRACGADRCSTHPSTADRCPESAGRCRRAPAAPSMASMTAWQTTSASEWPSAPRSRRDGHAAEDQRPSLDETVQVVAGAGTRPPPGRWTRQSRRAARRSLSVGRDLHVRPIALHHPDRDGPRARRAPLRRSRRRPRGRAPPRREHVAAKRLRRLRQIDRLRAECVSHDERRRAIRRPTRFTVSRAGTAAIAAPDSAAASIVRSISSGVTNGRAASWTSTMSACGPTASNACATESCRRRAAGDDANRPVPPVADVRADARRPARDGRRRRSRRRGSTCEERADAALRASTAHRCSSNCLGTARRCAGRAAAAMMAVTRIGWLKSLWDRSARPTVHYIARDRDDDCA